MKTLNLQFCIIIFSSFIKTYMTISAQYKQCKFFWQAAQHFHVDHTFQRIARFFQLFDQTARDWRYIQIVEHYGSEEVSQRLKYIMLYT